MSNLSPQGYNIEENPVNDNPFWDNEGVCVKSVQCTKQTIGNNDVYTWSYTDEEDVETPIITQAIPKSVSDGVTFTPFVSSDGIISWTNDGGLENPAPVSIKGPAGATGATGARGPKGDKGDAGPIGPAGATGARGPQGPQGVQGPQGLQGRTGAQGPKGDTGDTPNITADANVIQGDPASPASCTVTKTGTAENPIFTFTFQNVKGNKGDKGDTGETGARGPQGPAGMGTITIGTTTTGAAGTNAEVTNRGTAQDAILDFTIPQGATGATGARGPKGDNGANGVGVPAGGTAGQVLTKVDGTDFNTQWTTPASGGGGGIDDIQITKAGAGSPGCTYFTFNRGAYKCHMILLYSRYQVDDWGDVVCNMQDETSVMIYGTGTYLVPVTIYVVAGQGTAPAHSGILRMSVDYSSSTGLYTVTSSELWYNGTSKTLGNTGNWIAPISVLGFKK